MSEPKEAFVETVSDPITPEHLDFYGGIAQIQVAAFDLLSMPFVCEKFIEDDG